MFEAIRTSLTELRDYVAWAPDGLVGTAMLALAALLALVIHSVLIRLLLRLLKDRRPYLHSFLLRTMGLTRLALVVLALFVVLPAAPFDFEVESVVAKVLLVVAIGLLGWAAVTVVDMTADLYLKRFARDADNLYARKHLTQARVLARAIDTIVIVATVGAALMTFELRAALRRQPVCFRWRCRPGGRPGRPTAAQQPVRRHSNCGGATNPHRRQRAGRERGWQCRGDHIHLCGGQAVGPASPGGAAHLFHREAVPELDAGINPPHWRHVPACRPYGADRAHPCEGCRDRAGIASFGTVRMSSCR